MPTPQEEPASERSDMRDDEANLRETEAQINQLGRRLADAERERNRTRPEDWQTLFRQVATLATRLAEHPFIRGDAEAEQRVARMLRAPDLEIFDLRTDALAEYISGKLAFHAAMKAAAEGKAQPDPDRPRLRQSAPSSSEATRMAAAFGPSGSDFALPDLPPSPAGKPASPPETTTSPADADAPEDTAPDSPPPRRRSVLRL
ncbi:hypothetical protein [Pseudooceanicola aestuarii]|uniref:hypothetical protein n=1 Tax=Pseudooceanicola aestuarii TaxID=2697319 RepID=UPI0013D84A5E|nr:hypothetical protein [Pseudooceanicola aestuarii]